MRREGREHVVTGHRVTDRPPSAGQIGVGIFAIANPGAADLGHREFISAVSGDPFDATPGAGTGGEQPYGPSAIVAAVGPVRKPGR